MHVDSYETSKNLNNGNNLNLKIEPNSSCDQFDEVNNNWSNSYGQDFESIDLLTSPKFQQTIPKVDTTEGPLDLECLYYDQFQYTSSPEQNLPKTESCQTSFDSNHFQSNNQSPNSPTYSHIFDSNESPPTEITLESVIDDAISLESSFNASYASPTSLQIPIICQWIDCYAILETQEELVSLFLESTHF
jgi:hypothetical protein